MNEPQGRVDFPTTHWSLVVRAGGEADRERRDALELLCRDYWYPLFAFARRRGLDRDAACDLVQGFLADLIERRDLAKADPSRGRFRSFLRSACSHFLSNSRHNDRAAKRGGGRKPFSIDLVDAEQRYSSEPFHNLTAERLFERRWAMVLLERVLARLESESHLNGKSELFGRLRPMLEGGDASASYREIGASLQMTEASVKVAAHRLRRRYREILREEVGRTVADPSELDEEIGDLLRALT